MGGGATSLDARLGRQALNMVRHVEVRRNGGVGHLTTRQVVKASQFPLNGGKPASRTRSIANSANWQIIETILGATYMSPFVGVLLATTKARRVAAARHTQKTPFMDRHKIVAYCAQVSGRPIYITMA